MCEYAEYADVNAGALNGSSYLDRSVSVGLSEAQVNESGHGQTHIQPVTEAEVVDELKHILHTQEDQTHNALQTPTNTMLIISYSARRLPHW